MVQRAADGPRLVNYLATNEVVDAFVDANQRRWSDATYKYYCWSPRRRSFRVGSSPELSHEQRDGHRRERRRAQT